MIVDLIQAGAKSDTFTPTALEPAVQNDDIVVISIMLNLGVNVNKDCTYLGVRWVRNALPLATMVAIKNSGQNHEMFQLLLRTGADVNGSCPIPQGDSSLYTIALLFATKYNHLERTSIIDRRVTSAGHHLCTRQGAGISNLFSSCCVPKRM